MWYVINEILILESYEFRLILTFLKKIKESAIDTSNFDEEFTSETPQDSYVNEPHLSETVQRQFAGFTYNEDRVMSGSISSSVQDM